jgi:hypothetical protein
MDHQPATLAVQPVPHGAAAVRWQVVPQQHGLLPAQEFPQLLEDLDQLLGVVVARGEVEGELGAAAFDAVQIAPPWRPSSS